MLEVEAVTSGYVRAEVLHRVSMTVESGRTTCLLGPNGAGKTTLTRVIGGLHRCWSGRLLLDGRDVTNYDARAMVRNGVVQVLEGRHLFPRLSVLDNLVLGTYPTYRTLGSSGRSERLDTVFNLFPHLVSRRRQLAGTLSGGEQQMVAIGRALMAGPRILVLDEPVFGLSPAIADSIYESLSRLNEQGMTTVLAEEEPLRALSLPNVFAYVMVAGQVVMAKPGSGLEPEAVASIYLGTSLAATGED